MARERGNEKEPAESEPRADELDGGSALPGLPDIARRALALGLSGFFLTEETIRKALGDTLPQDWIDFASHQSERTRKEFLERLTFEIAQTLEKIDVAAVLDQLLQGRTIEVKAQVRLGERDESSARNVHISLKDDEADE